MSYLILLLSGRFSILAWRRPCVRATSAPTESVYQLTSNHIENNRTPLQMIQLHVGDIDYDEPIDFLSYGVEVNAEHVGDDNPRVKCNPIRSPLNPVNLITFKEAVQPLTMATPDNVLTYMFVFALNVINDLNDNKI